MPYFIKTGPEPKNKGGQTCQGYLIKRSHTTVLTFWGAIDIKGHRIKHMWVWKQSKPYRRKSIAEANLFKRKKIEELKRNGFVQVKKIYEKISTKI